MATRKTDPPKKRVPDEVAPTAAELDAREMLLASGQDPDDPHALRRLMDGSDNAIERLMHTRQEVADMCGFSLSHYVRLHDRGEGPVELVIGGVIRITTHHLHEWMAKRDVQEGERLKKAAEAKAAKAAAKEEALPAFPKPRRVPKIEKAINGKRRLFDTTIRKGKE